MQVYMLYIYIYILSDVRLKITHGRVFRERVDRYRKLIALKCTLDGGSIVASY